MMMTKQAVQTPAEDTRQPVVQLRDITKEYQMGEITLQVLKGISLSIYEGEFVAIMGPSGSGKSTLMNMIGALDKPTSGTYLLDGVDVSKLNSRQLARIRNQKIGFVFQQFNLLRRTTAIRQVELPLIYGDNRDRYNRAKAALEAVGLGDRLDHTPAELSGGQQQRVAIARALMQDPELMLADEPVASLDPATSHSVMKYLELLNNEDGLTILCSLHFLSLARTYADRVIALKDGKIEFDGTPAEIDNVRFKEIYGEDAVEVGIS